MFMTERFSYSEIVAKNPETQDKLYTLTLYKIKESVKRKSKKIKLFELKDDIGDNKTYMVELKYNKYKQNLHTALEFFKSVENYEMCQECKTLMDEL
tara:strand:- start:236 stop:526 length:291 start_codon:yes stop_codon:yes gene_type:complete